MDEEAVILFLMTAKKVANASKVHVEQGQLSGHENLRQIAAILLLHRG